MQIAVPISCVPLHPGVAFRPHRPWEVLSASLDASLIRWNFATGRPLRRWDMGAQEEGSQGAQVHTGCTCRPGRPL